MPQIMKHKRFKRATVLIKRTQCLGMYPRNKSCLPSYEKLKSNNSCLAKALSKQKQKGQLLFSQNVALLAEIQDLSSACNKRDNIMGKVLQNAKEMLTMLVTMTKYVTSTIAFCQEFATSSNSSFKMSRNSLLRGEDRRLSSRSPTRGIVKPMISGHTITKPTINLSRINLHRNNNPSNLNTIEEVSIPAIPVENSNVHSDTSPANVSARQPRNVTNRRMPERLNITSPRISEGDERRLSRRNGRHSGQLSERHSRSKSNRLSQSYIKRHSTEHRESMGSPRVKLNDVSKLLQNCQTINIRRLGSIKDDVANESLGVNDSINNTSTGTDNSISEAQVSMDFLEESCDLENSTFLDKSNDEHKQNNKKGCNSEEREEDIKKHNRSSHNNVPNLDDPLEGPSWMFNNHQQQSSLTNISMRTEKIRSSNKNTSIHRSSAKNSTSYTLQNNKENIQYCSSSSEDENSVKETNLDSSYRKKSADKSRISEKESILNNSQESGPTIKEDTTNMGGFVTRQRGHSFETIDDDIDDFTLMYRRRPINNIPFDIHDLKLPVLEDSVVKSMITKEPEPEITTTLQKITQNCLVSSDSNDVKEETLLDNFIVNLPLLSNTAIDCTIPIVDISLDTQQTKKQRKSSKTYERDSTRSITTPEKKKKQRKKHKNDKDPSAVKVVLQKLNDSHVKLQTPPPTESFSEDSNSLSTKVFQSLDNSSDSENSVASMNLSTDNSALKRPRRQKAPRNLKEPSLSKKLRRLH